MNIVWRQRGKTPLVLFISFDLVKRRVKQGFRLETRSCSLDGGVMF